MDKQSDFVLREIEDKGVKFVCLWFTDVVGALKSVAIAPAEVEVAFAEGIGFDGSAIEGLTRVYESDLLLSPDPATFRILPWRSGQNPVARMFCTLLTPDRQLAVSDPRNVLRRALEEANQRGFSVFLHPEIEFYLLTSAQVGPDGPNPVDAAGYFDYVAGGAAADFRRRSVRMLEEIGIPVEFSHHEAGPGQNEIDLRYADALTTADNIITFRAVMKEVALEQGIHTTFMPKPFSAHPGSGMHTHISLFEGERNAFYEPGSRYQLSRIGRHFIAGLLKHASEMSAITNQSVNSYKRLWGGAEAPNFVCWGHNNRSALVRVPLYKPNKAESSRVEYRAIDSAANPYLAFSLLLAAGLEGVEQKYELPFEVEENVSVLSDMERLALGYNPLPQSLEQAIACMEKSELVAKTLGERVFHDVLRHKKQEWEEYRCEVTPYEWRTHLEAF